MQHDGYENVNSSVSGKELGLGWLTGITTWSTTKAVSIQPHSHSHMELICCLRGELVYEVEGHGSVSVIAGTGVVIPERTVHVLRGGTDLPCERIGFHIARTMPPSVRFSVFTPSDFKGFRNILSKAYARTFRLDPALLATVRELSELMHQSPARHPAHKLALMRMLCANVLYRSVTTLSKPLIAPVPQMIDESIRFLEEHFAEKLNLDSLVRHMGYGRTQLFALFKKRTGLSPNEYLVRYRIRKAQELSEKHDMTVAQIASATGFASTSYFRSVFLRYTGQQLQ